MRKHGRALGVLTAGAAALVALFVTGVVPSGIQVVGTWVLLAAIHVGLAGVARSTARMPGLRRPVRRFWRAVSGAGVVYLIGDLVQVVVAAAHPLRPVAATGGLIQMIALSAGSAWLMLTLLTVPVGFASGRERARFWMDMATVMVAAVVVGWYLVVPNHPGDLRDTAASVLAGPVILLLCVFVVAKLVMSGTAPFTRACGLIGAGGAVLKSGADAVGRDGLADARLHWFLVCTVAAHALLAIALRVNQIQLAGSPRLLEPRGLKTYSLLPYGAIAATYALLTVAVVRDEPMTVAVALAGAAGSTVLVVLRQLAAFRDNARLLAELHTSLAERDALADRLHHQAFHDGLTGLPNRSLYAERLDAALLQRGPVVAMLIDLDDFKQVNDELGHAAGDALLREVAVRLTACLRETDTVARIGGDEFAVLLLPGGDDDPRDIAARMVETVEAPVTVPGGSVRVSASVGVAVATGLTENGDSLLRDADHAMYEAKREGKGNYAVAPSR